MQQFEFSSRRKDGGNEKVRIEYPHSLLTNTIVREAGGIGWQKSAGS